MKSKLGSITKARLVLVEEVLRLVREDKKLENVNLVPYVCCKRNLLPYIYKFEN